ncbi:MAG: GNAT family N-acetyltransferase [Clostridiales bacterium]|nr:GNAT family N-acetyltransferase [Roseburia sp.]MDD7635653.1 GNAT family N-acetyltransferase [Clostridiales bacterium]MDY4113550.1 GNAT family N-acetyltransferase [Roseburia sp.]
MKTTDIKFHEITLADKTWMDARFAEDDRNACEYTFANNFIWRKVYQVEVTEICECLVIRFVENKKYCYSYPVGAGDKKAAIERLLFICEQEKYPLVMSPLSEIDRQQLMKWFPGKFLIEADRDDFDYIYAREKLTSLAGKKLHGKRNHIARFKDGGDWSYEPMTDENLEECRTMTYSWIKMRSDKWNEEMEEEIMVLHEAFDHMKELGLVGGVLRREGAIVAFSMGEPLNSDTFVVHFEKAYPDMQGAYPMINQQFAINACEGYDYVNREEDTGDPGLRKAKLSYYPEILLKKYVAIQSDIVYANRDREGEQIEKIWETCFGDEKEYIRFYMEHRMTEENMLVIHEDGKAVSMASFLPVRYLCEGEYVDARYVYAVATLPEYRGRGLAKRILMFAHEHYGQPLILAPAEESLMHYYETLGFRKAFPDTRAWMKDTLAALEWTENVDVTDMIKPLTTQEYVQIRDEKCAKEGYVRWDENAVRYAIELCEHYGGGAGAVESAEGERDILMYEKDDDTLVILETSLGTRALQELLPHLLKETGTSRASYGQMPGMIWLPEAMEKTKISEQGYLALTLG